MALLKDITHPSGVTLSYWRIVEVNLNWYRLTGRIAVAGYTSQEARLAGAEPLDVRTFRVEAETFPTYFSVEALEASNSLASAYAFVKEEAEFQGATDA